jgi:hypothetical protein
MMAVVILVLVAAAAGATVVSLAACVRLIARDRKGERQAGDRMLLRMFGLLALVGFAAVAYVAYVLYCIVVHGP